MNHHERKSGPGDTAPTSIEYDGWPVGTAHKQTLYQILEYTTESISRSNNAFNACHDTPELDSDTIKQAAEEITQIRDRVIAAGSLASELLETHPTLGNIPEEELDTCTKYYSCLEEVSSTLKTAWSKFNDAYQSAIMMSNDSPWERVSDTDMFANMIGKAHKSLVTVRNKIMDMLSLVFDEDVDKILSSTTSLRAV